MRTGRVRQIPLALVKIGERLLKVAMRRWRLPLDVVLPEPVNANEVGRANCVRRSPATITTLSPRLYRLTSSIAMSTCATMASVVFTCARRRLHTPGQRELVADLERAMIASTGSGVCSRASRRTVSPE